MRVCYKLRREIEGLFPPKTTFAERILGLFIADRARSKTRIALISPDDFPVYTGLDRRGLQDVLRNLRDDRHLEFRVIIGTGSHGRQLYAVPCNPPQYRVPEIDEFRAAWELSGDLLATLPHDR